MSPLQAESPDNAVSPAIAINNPEVKLMVVLVDRLKVRLRALAGGDLITFDNPPRPYPVAELAIERAKRLVEVGDVVILLDGITMTCLQPAAPAPDGSCLVASTGALYPPKKSSARPQHEGGGRSPSTALVRPARDG
jgi:transcription termination factor Rho